MNSKALPYRAGIRVLFLGADSGSHTAQCALALKDIVSTEANVEVDYKPIDYFTPRERLVDDVVYLTPSSRNALYFISGGWSPSCPAEASRALDSILASCPHVVVLCRNVDAKPSPMYERSTRAVDVEHGLELVHQMINMTRSTARYNIDKIRVFAAYTSSKGLNDFNLNHHLDVVPFPAFNIADPESAYFRQFVDHVADLYKSRPLSDFED